LPVAVENPITNNQITRRQRRIKPAGNANADNRRGASVAKLARNLFGTRSIGAGHTNANFRCVKHTRNNLRLGFQSANDGDEFVCIFHAIARIANAAALFPDLIDPSIVAGTPVSV